MASPPFRRPLGERMFRITRHKKHQKLLAGARPCVDEAAKSSDSPFSWRRLAHQRYGEAWDVSDQANEATMVFGQEPQKTCAVSASATTAIGSSVCHDSTCGARANTASCHRRLTVRPRRQCHCKLRRLDESSSQRTPFDLSAFRF